MSSVAVKGEEGFNQSPVNTEQSQQTYFGDGDESQENELSPELAMINSRKESHRASERVSLSPPPDV